MLYTRVSGIKAHRLAFKIFETKLSLSEEEKEKALTLLMNHYHPVSVKFNPKFVHMTQCMKIIVNDMTAKRAMPKKNTLDYKVMQFQGEVRSPHMYEEKNRS